LTSSGTQAFLWFGEAVFQIDDRLQRREQHFELLELLGRVTAEIFEVDLLAGLQLFDKLSHASR
jgi:hypothetical protein